MEVTERKVRMKAWSMSMSSRIVVINNRWAFLAGSSMATGVAVFVVVVLLSLVVMVVAKKRE